MSRYDYDPEDVERYDLHDFIRLSREAEAEAELYEAFCREHGLDPRKLESELVFRGFLDEGGGTEGDTDGANGAY